MMKPLMKKTLIAASVAMALAACQNLEQEPKGEKQANKSDKETELVELNIAQEEKRQLIELQQKQRQIAKKPVTTTGSRIMADSIDYNHTSPLVMPVPPVAENRENYKHFDDNGVFVVSENPVSTFSIDVDTASYTNVRRILNEGVLPPKDAVRLEEFINYFDYDFAGSKNLEKPFSVNTSVMAAPWNQDAHLVQIGIKGYEPEEKPLPASNLVFLVDVSGSMQSPKKLGLVKRSLKLLIKQLSAKDKVSLVVYAGASGVVLDPTSGDNKIAIEQAIDRLTAGGSTNGAAGIELAYQMAKQGFIKEGINRVILATDGDFNVGVTNHEQLMELIESKRKSNIFFSSLGFGRGNYNDHLMEQLANKGNGNAAYIDSLQEAKKVLVDERAGTLMTIAKDVKIQVEFNPQVVSEYRLLGYENRLLNREDFNNDKVDAGEIGAGHTITALYEVVLNDSKAKRVDPLRYSQERQAAVEQQAASGQRLANEAAMVKLRYKMPDGESSRLIQQPLYRTAFDKPQSDKNIQFAASAAGFAQLLRGGKFVGDWNWQDAITYARQAKGKDHHGYRAEMIRLMEMAQLLSDEVSDQVSDEKVDRGKVSTNASTVQNKVLVSMQKRQR
ncbi:VWA domain-containing protein [Kangiella sp. TOML190]|uniref:vWA domain-containing protein n=1 Tax=Kangiella sp. TOML190 TaxID=2931351 RepID=UPI00203D92D5|nr:VWA domain-containing protein [Kangiella sp. TOML190]